MVFLRASGPRFAGLSRLAFTCLVCFCLAARNFEWRFLWGGVLLEWGGPLEPTFQETNQTLAAKGEGFLLSVPFYIYPQLDMIDEATVGDQPMHDFIASKYVNGQAPKHADDYYFIEGAKKHPMRTFIPEEAKIFVVPVPANQIIWSIVNKAKDAEVCWKGKCGHDLMKYTEVILSQSKWFQRTQGNDHIATFGIWGWREVGCNAYQYFRSCHWLGFGETAKRNARGRNFFFKFYPGRRCDDAPEKLYDFAMIASIKPNDERFQSRKDICDWTSGQNWSVCGKGSQCPALAQSKFGFHARGDSFGANRLFDTILSGTVPIFTMKEQYEIQPDWYDWEAISYFANVRNKTEFQDDVEQIRADQAGYEQRHRTLLENRALFDWTTPFPFDTYMYMLQSQLYPETKRSATQFEILKLP